MDTFIWSVIRKIFVVNSFDEMFVVDDDDGDDEKENKTGLRAL